MGKTLISLIARTPSTLQRILRWSGWAIAAFIVVDLLIGTIIGKEYMLASKHLRPMIASSAMIFLGSYVIIKICINFQELTTLNSLELKERNNQIKQYIISFASGLYIVSFIIIAKLSYNVIYIDWVMNNKAITIAIFTIYVFSYIYLIYTLLSNADELFITDQLWANFIAIWFYAIFFPSWWILHRFKLSPEPNDWVIYGLTMLVGMAVLTYRQKKLNNKLT